MYRWFVIDGLHKCLGFFGKRMLVLLLYNTASYLDIPKYEVGCRQT